MLNLKSLFGIICIIYLIHRKEDEQYELLDFSRKSETPKS